MNGLTPSLQAAQAANAPAYTLVVEAAARAQGAPLGGEAWQGVAALPAALATWNQQSIAHDAAASAQGVMRVLLSHIEGALVCQWCTGDVTLSATWTTPAVSTIAAFAPSADIATPKPALLHVNGIWHLWYSLPAGNILHRTSSNNGATWSAASTLYAGGDVVGALFACHLPQHDLYCVQFSTYTDVYRPRGLSRSGAGAWSVWPLHSDGAGWLPAGMVALDGTHVRQFLVATATQPGVRSTEQRIASLDCTLTTGGALESRSAAPQILHYAAGASPIKQAQQAIGSGFGGCLLTVQLQGASRTYLAAGRVQATAAEPALLGEPLPVATVALPVTPLERHTIALEYGDATLLVGLAQVWRSQHNHAALGANGDDVIAYRYTAQEASSGGTGGMLTMQVRPGSALAAVQPGYTLWLTRTCTKGAEGGSVTLGFQVQRVEMAPDAITISARDALGMLAQARTLISLHISNEINHAYAVQALAAWAGVDAQVDLPGAGAAPLMRWGVGEEALHALMRLLHDQGVVARSRCVAAGNPCVAIAAPANAPLYEYDVAGGARHLIARHVRIADARTCALFSARGLAVRNEPDEGEDWALASVGALSPLLRPQVHAWENRNASSAMLASVAQAWAARQAMPVVATLETHANLALEVHDCIVVAGATYRVLRITEQWERRRCTQHVELGNVEQ